MEFKIIKKPYHSPEFEFCKVEITEDALNNASQPDNGNWDWNDDDWGSGGFDPNMSGGAEDF